MANKWNEKEQGAKRRRSNQGTRGTARTQPAASNPNKNRKSTDTNRNSGRTVAAKPAPNAAPKAAPKQNKPKTVYYSNKNKGVKGVAAGVKAATRAANNTATKKAEAKYPQTQALRTLSRQAGARNYVTGRDIPLAMNRPKTFQQTVTPLEQMKADAVAGPKYWGARAIVPSKKLTAEQQKKKNQQTAKQSGFNARARKQTLSSYDQKLSQGKQFQIQQAKQRYDEAKAKGDRTGMEKAHREAENLRYTAGYSGGATGNERIAPKLSQDDYNRLNSSGRLAMTQAQMTRDRATTEEEIARADRRIEEILNAPGYRNNRLSATETGKGWSYGPDGRRMWAGTKEQNRADAAPGLAALRAVGEGAAGGLLYAGQTASRATRDKFERENIDKWIADEANYNQAKSRLEFIQDYKRQFGVVPDGYNEMQAQIDYNNAVQARAQLARIQRDPDSLYYDETHANTMRELMRDRYSLPGLDGFESPVSAMLNDTPTTRDETLGERLLRQAAEDQAKATEGMNGVERFVTNALISTGQSVPGMALGLIPGVGPALGLGVLGAQAGGSRAYDLRQQGVTAEDAYRAGFISGGIEALTEKLPLENFAQIIKSKNGKSALRNILEQAGLEGSEEAVSYVGNYIADVAQQNPDAHFSWLELLENAGMGAIGGAAFGVAGGILSPGHAVSPAGAQSEEIQEQARGAATQIEAIHDAETQIRTAAAQRLREDAQAYNEMVKAGVWSDAEKEMVKASLDQRYAEIAGQNAGQTSHVANQAPLTQVFEDGMQRNRGRAERAPAASVPTPLAANETPASVNPVEQAERMTAEALRATDAEMARRDAVAQLQAETPPITYERSGLPPTSFLGAAIDARREARARAEAEAQVRRDQEIARQNRVAAEQQTTTTNGPAEISTTIRRNEQAQVQQPVSRLEGLASTFGESGAASLRTIGGKMVTGQGAFVRDFTDVYNQVLGGRSERQVSRPAGMSDANYFAAVTAAQNDRQTGWDLDILKASKAAGRNVNAGVDWRDQYVRQMDRKTARTVDGLAKALGVKVVFAEKGSILTAGGTAANAEITGNVVRIEKGNPNPVRMLIGHELTHRMQDVSPDTYRAFRDYAMSVPGSMDALERTVSLYQKAGAFRGQDNARQMAMDEVTADFAGSLLENSEQLQEFIRRNYENRTMLEVIRDFFRALAAKLTGRERAQADEAVRLLEEAISGASKQLQQSDRRNRQNVNRRSAAKNMGVDLATNAAEAEEYGRYSLVTDKNTLDFLENQDHVTVYRAMQVIDGKLYPPMAAKVKSEDGKKTLVEAQKIGEWYQSDEKPELIPKKKTVKDKKTGKTREQGYFILDKGDGSTPLNVAYNPYFHTSASPLNDQFSSAHKRPNLVTVECEIPKSELSSGYRAEFAKDTVGETKWHAGPVASKLKGAKARRVFLSRWAKVNRIVPDVEVAKVIANTLKGEDVAVPTNVVTPSLLAELRANGVKIEEVKGKGGRFSLGGINAQTANVQRLSEAKKMERKGKTEEEIRQATGWLKGPDGKWRFEISDEKARFDLTGDVRGRASASAALRNMNSQFASISGSERFDQNKDKIIEYMDRIGNSETEAEAWDQVEDIYNELSDKMGHVFTDWADSYFIYYTTPKENRSVGRSSLTLADYLDHPELFKAYPELKDIAVEIEALKEGVNGRYDHNTKTISISNGLKDSGAILDTLSHEVQHAIQRIEGFASGASPEYWETRRNAGWPIRTKGEQKKLRELREKLADEYDENKALVNDVMRLNRITPTVPRGEVDWDTLEQIEEDPPEWQEFDRQREALEAKYGDMKVFDLMELVSEIERLEKGTARTPRELYWMTAGEVEAREVADRREMSEEERRKTPPRLGGDDVVFANGARYSITPQADADYMAAVESGDMETAQRMVDEAAKAAMPNSKVRGADGDLLRMYHGTKADFTAFDRKFIGSQGSFEGAGFNYTPYESRAKGYGSKVLSGFVNVEKPLSAERKTISVRGLAELIRAIDPTGDNIIANYAQNTRDYGTATFVTREARVTARAIWDFAENDVDIYSELSAVSPDSDSLIGALEGMGYDGLIHYDDNGNIKTVITLNSQQFKSADAVTYDDNGDVIPLSERFNAETGDIRYSIGTEGYDRARLMRENQELKEKLEYWRGQVKKSDRTKADPKEVRKLAKSLRADYSTDMDAGEITQRLQAIYDGIGKDWSYDRAYEEAGKLARDMIEQATATKDYLYAEYAPMREFFRDTPLVVTKEMQRAIPDYNEWRKPLFGKLRLKGGEQTNVDQVFQEAVERWPEFFNEEVSSHSLDQLDRIVEVLDNVYRRDEINPFEDDMSTPAGYLATAIMDMYWDIPAVKKTFADRMQNRLNRQIEKTNQAKEQGRERVQAVREQKNQRIKEVRAEERAAARQRERDQRDRRRLEDEANNDWREAENDLLLDWREAKMKHETQVEERKRGRKIRERSRRNLRAKLREKYQKSLREVREQRDRKLREQSEKYLTAKRKRSQKQKERELRAKIQRHVKKLSTKLRTPTDTQHIPEDLIPTVRTALESINLASKDMKDTKRTQAFEALRKMYQEMDTNGSEVVIDPDLIPNISDIIGFADTPIANLGLEDLNTIWNTVKAIENSISTFNKALGRAKFETISQPAFGIRDYLTGRKDRGDYRGPFRQMDKLLNFNMLTPEAYFLRMGNSGKEVFRMLRDAQDRHITIMDQAQRKTREIVGKTNIRKLEKEMHTFTFDGQTVELTTAQIMSLYELMKRQQAVDHVMIGGIRPESVKKGIKDLPPARPWHLTQDQVSAIVDSLTEEQVKLADELQQYMGGTMAELGNEASMEVYGYRKFTEKHYFPISVDKNQTQSDVKNDAVSGTIAGWGSARPVKPNANNAVILRSIFDVYADHTTEMANYASWLAPMENMNRIFNFRYKDEEGNQTGTMKDQLETLFGKNGEAYWKQLQNDLNNGVHGRDDSPFSALMGTYKASAIGANIRVIAQQPTAILRAMDSINPADFVAGMARARIGKFDNIVKQYAPIAIWKDWGYFQQDTGRQMRNVLFNDDTKLQKANSAMMWGAGKADSLSWTAIWNALESETRRKRKDLRYKSREFYEAVAERFNEVVDHTQVVDGILQRSQIMRSADGLTKMATSFMAEPTKTYNMMLSAIYEARNAKGRERSAAMGKLAKTAFALTVSITVNAAAQSLVDAIRDDDKDEDYWEKFIQAYFGLEGETRKEQIKNGILNGNLEAAFNPLTYIPYLKDIVSQTQGYSVSRMDMDTISRVLKAFTNVEKAMSGEGKNTVQSAWLNLALEASRFLGLSAANLKRDVQTVLRTFFAGTGNYRMLYKQEKFLYDVTSKNTLTEFSKLILGAERAGDDEAAQAIRQDMIDSGVDAEKIDKKLAELRKKAVTDTEEYQTALAQKTDAYQTMLEADARFNGLDEDKQENVRKRLNDYAQYQVLGQSMDVENDKMEKIADAESHKVPAADWVVFTAAADAIEADYKPDGTLIQGSKKKKVVALIDSYDIPSEGKSYMYLSRGYSEKDNPYQ